jgi:hypothetical protein
VYEATAKAMASFGQPSFDAPLAIAELRDIPGLIKSLHKKVKKVKNTGDPTGDPAEDWLSYNFGISPLVSDMRTLVALQSSIASKARALQSAVRRGSVGGSLSTLPQPTYPYGTSERYVLTLPGIGYTYLTEKQFSVPVQKAWFSAKVEPDGWTMSDRDDLTLGLESLGMGASSNILWMYETIPWSFLIDYFTNLGDLIAANGNRFPWKVRSLCIMNHLEVKTELVPEEYRGIAESIVNGSNTHVFKYRDVSYPALGLAFSSLLTGSQIANIGALLASNASRR